MCAASLPDIPASIVHPFVQTCEQRPDKLCLRFAGQSYSYAHLLRAAQLWAGRLTANSDGSAGVQPGDRVGLYLGNSADFLAAYLGVHLAGGIVVLINTQYRQAELRHILNDAGVSVCITDSMQRPELDRVRLDTPTLQRIELATDDGLLSSTESDTLQPAAMAFDLPRPDDIALLAYTSGTTGRSKGAMLRHRNLAANSAAVTAAWRWTDEDVLLLTLPLFHIHGLGVGIHGTLLTGAATDLRRRFDAAEVYDTLLEETVTMFFGVPTMYTRLIAEAQQRDRLPPPIRLYVSGSAPLDPQTFAEFERLFGQPILERYGMTETVMNLTNPYDGERRPGTVGHPFPGQEARIVDQETRQPVPFGTPGEIQVRGPHVFAGYWQRPDATAEMLTADGWLNTGDLGWQSEDGYVTISGRAKELIISGGYNVYPREVEEVLLTHPAVSEAAVVGLPHPDLGEQVVAVVVPGEQQNNVEAQFPVDGLTTDDERLRTLAEDLVAFSRDQLAAYKKPRRVFFVSELPRNALGKIQKHVLRDRLQPE
jgi:malonyl-CoA/methylmalonyl-CoA synthetase